MADEAVVDRLVWPVLSSCITPTQAVTDDKDNPADNPPIINPRNPVRKWKIRLNLAHLRIGHTNQIAHGNASFASPMNQPSHHLASIVTGPETRLNRLIANVCFYEERIFLTEFGKPAAFFEGKTVTISSVELGKVSENLAHAVDRLEHGNDSHIATGE